MPGALSRRLQLALAALSGLLYVTAFPGVDQSWLGFVAWVPVLVALRGVTTRRAVLLGAVVGFTSHLGGYYWVTHLLREFAFLPTPVAALGWLLVCVGQGASFGVGIGISHWLGTRTGWPRAVTLAVGLTLMDFLYPLVFPSYVANTMGSLLWMMQGAELVGVLGVTTLVAAINGALADVVAARFERRPFPRRVAAVTGGVWAAALVFGAVRVAQIDEVQAKADQLKVGLVQSNLGGYSNHRKAREGHERHLRATRELHAQGVELVVWPEGAYHGQIVPGRTNVRDDVLGGTPQALLFGGARWDRDPAGDEVPFNSAFLADETGAVRGTYDKSVLLAFGEYIPGDRYFPGLYRWFRERGIAVSHFGRGTSTRALVLPDEARGAWHLGTFICYEDIVPEYVRRIMAPVDGVRPHVLVNVTNDSWYGDTTEPPIHLSEARWRAIEHRRALVRATNTGISAIVDATGRVVGQTATYREETLVGPVARMTVTTGYQLVGELAGWVALAVLVAGALVGRRRRAGLIAG